MDDETESEKEDLKEQIEERKEYLEKYEILIKSFIEYSKTKEIILTIDNFDYIRTIGVVAIFPNIVTLLNQKVILDKEHLIEMDVLEKEFRKEKIASGYFYSDKFMVGSSVFQKGLQPIKQFFPEIY